MEAPTHFRIGGQTIIGKYTQRVYWSNEDGWVDKDSATVFRASERWNIMLPFEATVICWFSKNS